MELERETRFELATSTLARKMPMQLRNINFSLEMLSLPTSLLILYHQSKQENDEYDDELSQILNLIIFHHLKLPAHTFSFTKSKSTLKYINKHWNE